MPIQVTCTGCKAQFFVSEKFAGKQGPCPKCKTVITIPKGPAAPAAAAAATAAKPSTPAKPGAPAKSAATTKPGAPPAAPSPPPAAVEVKIHGPEEEQAGGKTKTGRPIAKPLFHRDVRLTWKFGLVVLGAVVVLFTAAWFGGRFVRAPAPLASVDAANAELVAAQRTQLAVAYGLRAVALLLIGWPIIVAGYLVLYDDELEPYRGRGLMLRTAICLLVYVAVWGAYALIPADLRGEGYMWLFFAPAMILPAAAAAYFGFDLDYLGSVIHACFFLVVTLLLGWTAGLHMPWQPPPQVQAAPLEENAPLEFEFANPSFQR